MARLLEVDAVRERLARLPVESYPAGATVLAAGTVTGRLLILAEGSVEVVKDGVRIGEVAEPGVVFGELAALLDQPHTADVRALSACTFHVADAAELLRSDPLAALHVATIMAKRLDAANRALVEVRQQVEAGRPRSAIGRALDRLAEALRQDTDPELAKHMYAAWL